MADFVELIKIKDRMHDEIGNCNKCPIGSANNGKRCLCGEFLLTYPEQAQEILLKWAEEHPIMTNADMFEKVFGHKVENNECPLIGNSECFHNKSCGDCPNKDFWKQRYKEPEVKS